MDLFDLAVANKLAGGGGGGGDIDVDALTVTENGKYTASAGHAYSPVTVSVPQGVFPSGTSQITSNGIYDVSNFASASVNVPQPTGTSVITSNGLYNVTDFSQASVSVPTGITPSGTSSITANGIYDITSFASVDVNVSGGGGGWTAEDLLFRSISGSFTTSARSIYTCAFQECFNLTEITFTNLSTLSPSALYKCSSLSTATLIQATSNNPIGIGTSAFRSCINLVSVIIKGVSVATVQQTNAFMGTPISQSSYLGYFGSIYVPSSLVDTYKSAANWSAYSSRITAIVE